MLTCLGVQGFYVFIRAIQLLTAKNPGTVVVCSLSVSPVLGPVSAHLSMTATKQPH